MRCFLILTFFLSLTGALFALELIPTPSEIRLDDEVISAAQASFISRAAMVNRTITWSTRDKGFAKEMPMIQNFLFPKEKKLERVKENGFVTLIRVTDSALGEEGYRLSVEKNDKIILSAQTDTGIFYAIQTLSQLIAVRGFIPHIEIVDKPRTRWRGLMIDSGRQYQRIETLKRYIDIMASLKMNVFHWHLTEGAGWRIEIKKYPKLTSVGANVAQGAEQQGFYTQDEIRDLVAYAAARHIIVMPEIDVPGHTEAALTAYPEYSCFGVAPGAVGGFSDVIFCAGKDSATVFLKDVLQEVTDLFPGKYIHLGGDEAPKKQWMKCPDCQTKMKSLGLENIEKLQPHFMSELIRFLATKNRTAVVWNDAIHSDPTQLPRNLMIQWWTGPHGIEDAVKGNYKVIASTNHYCYMNYPVKPWGGYKGTVDAQLTYDKNPSYTDHPSVIGMTAALWTDYNLTESLLNRRLFPRLYILAEQMWFNGKLTPFNDFYKRVKTFHYPLLKQHGLNPGYGFQSEFPPNDKNG